jgi:PPOX class probable F420-dependent enzyme
MKLDAAQARERFAAARVARLSTVDANGNPHLVPVTFAVNGDTVVIAVDAKPKRSKELKRLRNIEANPSVSLLVDEYSEDWSRLWWVRADGNARVQRDAERMREPIDWLAGKYQQYRQSRPDGPVIEVQVGNWSGWSAA